MRIAGHFEHRLLERTLRSWVNLWPRLSEYRRIIDHHAYNVVRFDDSLERAFSGATKASL